MIYGEALARFDGMHVRQDRREGLEGGVIPGMTRGDEYGADAQGGEFAQVRQQVAEARLPVFSQVEVAGHRLLDLRVVTPGRRAVLSEHPQLARDVVRELGAGQVEQVAGVGVPRDE